ncbi:helix-turn-helix domain-containing protein [Pseudophaeobacter leonis]|uniref:AraC-like ligand-binding domain-containing protein n=1 Tax=Pseudophaeobacter leonis TaxID=1144477 RepID=UPI0009F22DC8|nr:helix-turn-helix domain-containing protein [Pseudophaeobacter leonis]
MEFVFSTDQYAREERYNAWRSAICDCYVHVDVEATDPEDYKGFIHEKNFGDLVLTDILVSQQTIRRNQKHISKLDKDCFYVQFIHSGKSQVRQLGEVHSSNTAQGALFCATEQYELECIGDVRSFYLKIPREEFAQRFPKKYIPTAANIDTTQGLGRITTEFCAMLATEGARLGEEARGQLGKQLLDVLALTLQAPTGDLPGKDSSIRAARLRSVKLWIERNIGDDDLSLGTIAAANGMSLRYLHQLFRDGDMSVSEWIWDRRLLLCYHEIAKCDGRLLTTIAYKYGFNNSAHFSTAFRRKFGFSPRQLATGKGH